MRQIGTASTSTAAGGPVTVVLEGSILTERLMLPPLGSHLPDATWLVTGRQPHSATHGIGAGAAVAARGRWKLVVMRPESRLTRRLVIHSAGQPIN